jgi:hypothetical protein
MPTHEFIKLYLEPTMVGHVVIGIEVIIVMLVLRSMLKSEIGRLKKAVFEFNGTANTIKIRDENSLNSSQGELTDGVDRPTEGPTNQG